MGRCFHFYLEFLKTILPTSVGIGYRLDWRIVSVALSQVVWFLLGKDEASMNKWMTAINAQIHGLFIKLYNVPEDNYWSQG